MRALFDLLKEPGIDALDIDGEKRIAYHRAVIDRKPMIRDVFLEFHALFFDLNRRYLEGEGAAIEIGAGVAPMRDSHPDVLSSDIVFGPHLDLVLDAQQMALSSGSVRVVYAQNSFHHFPQPERFLSELQRILIPGGGAVLLEPFHGPLASLLYKRLFRSEGFDKEFQSWETPTTGPMNGANQALSYIVFVRDRTRFERSFPSLQIVHSAPVGNYLRYLVSGGLNFRQLLPDAASGLLASIERVVARCNHWLALHHVIVLKKVTA